MGIPSWATVGAKVAYIGGPIPGPYTIPACGPLDPTQTYTLRGTFIDPATGLPGCWINEAHHRVNSRLGMEYGYPLSHFRPLVTRSQEQDIAEHFSHHLHQRASRKTEERV